MVKQKNKKYIEVLEAQGDYDVVNKEKEVFGFISYGTSKNKKGMTDSEKE